MKTTFTTIIVNKDGLGSMNKIFDTFEKALEYCFNTQIGYGFEINEQRRIRAPHIATLLNPKHVYSIFDTNGKLIKKYHGFKHIPPHSLRHTAISMQLAIGVPLKVVSKMAGHSNERITLDIYTHCTQEQETKAAELYNNFLCDNA